MGLKEWIFRAPDLEAETPDAPDPRKSRDKIWNRICVLEKENLIWFGGQFWGEKNLRFRDYRSRREHGGKGQLDIKGRRVERKSTSSR